jgi:hypothetical protein
MRLEAAKTVVWTVSATTGCSSVHPRLQAGLASRADGSQRVATSSPPPACKWIGHSVVRLTVASAVSTPKARLKLQASWVHSAMTPEDDIEQGSRSRSPSRDNEQGQHILTPAPGTGTGTPDSTGTDTPDPMAQERSDIILAAQAVPDNELWVAVRVELSAMVNWQRALRLYILLMRYWRHLLARHLPAPEDDERMQAD